MLDYPSQGHYLAWNYGIRPDVGDNGPPLNALINTIRGSNKGGRVYFEPSPYTFQTAIVDPLATVNTPSLELIGCGAGATYFQATGSLLTSGNLLTPGRKFHCFSMTIGATATRSGGSLIKVVGEIPLSAIRSMEIEFGGCSMENGFDGVTLEDNGINGVCGFFWDGSFSIARGFAANGTVFDINTPNGVINQINNTTHLETAGVADGSRPAATMRVRGAADFRMTRVESVYARRGLVIDPPAAGRAATVFMSECIWGATTQEAVRVDPNATAESHSIEMTGGYIDTGGMYFGPNAKAIYVANLSMQGNTPNDAIRLDGCSAMTFESISFASGNAKCFHALANAKNFRLTGHFRNVAAINTVGVHIEAGCDKYQIHTVGNEYCTTPLTEPTPGANRSVIMF